MASRCQCPEPHKVKKLDEDMKYMVVHQVGDFRMIQWYETGGSNGTVLIQHRHDTPVHHELFSWDHWAYCWQGASNCIDCETPVPDVFNGMLYLCKYAGVN